MSELGQDPPVLDDRDGSATRSASPAGQNSQNIPDHRTPPPPRSLSIRRRNEDGSRDPSRSRSRRRNERSRSPPSSSRSISPSSSERDYRSRSRSYDDQSRSPRSHSPSRSPASRSSRSRSRSSSSPPARKPIAQPSFRREKSLKGHTDAVSQVRISPDGRWIASASADRTAKIWDAGTGACVNTLDGHMAGLSCLAWSPDSNTLATGSDDKLIRLWDRVRGSPAHTCRSHDLGLGLGKRGPSGVLRGHHGYVSCVAFSPKGNVLASGSYDEAVFLWDVRAARLMRSLPAHQDPVEAVDFCRDGTVVASCSTDGLM
jgi:COMPASS component SWD3